MVNRLIDFSIPDRFVADAIGEPGHRTFYLQAQQGAALLTVGLEKTQLAALAAGMERVIQLIPFDPEAPEETATARDDAPLRQPVAEAFRVGTLALSWDASAATVVIEAEPIVGEAQDRAEAGGGGGSELLRVRLSAPAARDFVRRALRLVAAGRPLCPFCGQALEASGHLCPRLSLN